MNESLLQERQTNPSGSIDRQLLLNLLNVRCERGHPDLTGVHSLEELAKVDDRWDTSDGALSSLNLAGIRNSPFPVDEILPYRYPSAMLEYSA